MYNSLSLRIKFSYTQQVEVELVACNGRKLVTEPEWIDLV